MTNLKLPTIAREVRLAFRKDSDLDQTLDQPSVNTLSVQSEGMYNISPLVCCISLA